MTCPTPSRRTNGRPSMSTPRRGKDHPVVVWIHGGGWHSGDKKDVKEKPQAFTDKGFVFVSINYRFVRPA